MSRSAPWPRSSFSAVGQPFQATHRCVQHLSAHSRAAAAAAVYAGACSRALQAVTWNIVAVDVSSCSSPPASPTASDADSHGPVLQGAPGPEAPAQRLAPLEEARDVSSSCAPPTVEENVCTSADRTRVAELHHQDIRDAPSCSGGENRGRERRSVAVEETHQARPSAPATPALRDQQEESRDSRTAAACAVLRTEASRSDVAGAGAAGGRTRVLGPDREALRACAASGSSRDGERCRRLREVCTAEEPWLSLGTPQQLLVPTGSFAELRKILFVPPKRCCESCASLLGSAEASGRSGDVSGDPRDEARSPASDAAADRHSSTSRPRADGELQVSCGSANRCQTSENVEGETGQRASCCCGRPVAPDAFTVLEVSVSRLRRSGPPSQLLLLRFCPRQRFPRRWRRQESRISSQPCTADAAAGASSEREAPTRADDASRGSSPDHVEAQKTHSDPAEGDAGAGRADSSSANASSCEGAAAAPPWITLENLLLGPRGGTGTRNRPRLDRGDALHGLGGDGSRGRETETPAAEEARGVLFSLLARRTAAADGPECVAAFHVSRSAAARLLSFERRRRSRQRDAASCMSETDQWLALSACGSAFARVSWRPVSALGAEEEMRGGDGLRAAAPQDEAESGGEPHGPEEGASAQASEREEELVVKELVFCVVLVRIVDWKIAPFPFGSAWPLLSKPGAEATRDSPEDSRDPQCVEAIRGCAEGREGRGTETRHEGGRPASLFPWNPVQLAFVDEEDVHASVCPGGQRTEAGVESRSESATRETQRGRSFSRKPFQYDSFYGKLLRGKDTTDPASVNLFLGAVVFPVFYFFPPKQAAAGDSRAQPLPVLWLRRRDGSTDRRGVQKVPSPLSGGDSADSAPGVFSSLPRAQGHGGAWANASAAPRSRTSSAVRSSSLDGQTATASAPGDAAGKGSGRSRSASSCEDGGSVEASFPLFFSPPADGIRAAEERSPAPTIRGGSSETELAHVKRQSSSRLDRHQERLSLPAPAGCRADPASVESAEGNLETGLLSESDPAPLPEFVDELEPPRALAGRREGGPLIQESTDGRGASDAPQGVPVSPERQAQPDGELSRGRGSGEEGREDGETRSAASGPGTAAAAAELSEAGAEADQEASRLNMLLQPYSSPLGWKGSVFPFASLQSPAPVCVAPPSPVVMGAPGAGQEYDYRFRQMYATWQGQQLYWHQVLLQRFEGEQYHRHLRRASQMQYAPWWTRFYQHLQSHLPPSRVPTALSPSQRHVVAQEEGVSGEVSGSMPGKKETEERAAGASAAPAGPSTTRDRHRGYLVHPCSPSAPLPLGAERVRCWSDPALSALPAGLWSQPVLPCQPHGLEEAPAPCLPGVRCAAGRSALPSVERGTQRRSRGSGEGAEASGASSGDDGEQPASGDRPRQAPPQTSKDAPARCEPKQVRDGDAGASAETNDAAGSEAEPSERSRRQNASEGCGRRSHSLEQGRRKMEGAHTRPKTLLLDAPAGGGLSSSTPATPLASPNGLLPATQTAPAASASCASGGPFSLAASTRAVAAAPFRAAHPASAQSRGAVDPFFFSGLCSPGGATLAPEGGGPQGPPAAFVPAWPWIYYTLPFLANVCSVGSQPVLYPLPPAPQSQRAEDSANARRAKKGLSPSIPGVAPAFPAIQTPATSGHLLPLAAFLPHSPQSFAAPGSVPYAQLQGFPPCLSGLVPTDRGLTLPSGAAGAHTHIGAVHPALGPPVLLPRFSHFSPVSDAAASFGPLTLPHVLLRHLPYAGAVAPPPPHAAWTPASFVASYVPAAAFVRPAPAPAVAAAGDPRGMQPSASGPGKEGAFETGPQSSPAVAAVSPWVSSAFAHNAASVSPHPQSRQSPVHPTAIAASGEARDFAVCPPCAPPPSGAERPAQQLSPLSATPAPDTSAAWGGALPPQGRGNARAGEGPRAGSQQPLPPGAEGARTPATALVGRRTGPAAPPAWLPPPAESEAGRGAGAPSKETPESSGACRTGRAADPTQACRAAGAACAARQAPCACGELQRGDGEGTRDERSGAGDAPHARAAPPTGLASSPSAPSLAAPCKAPPARAEDPQSPGQSAPEDGEWRAASPLEASRPDIHAQAQPLGPHGRTPAGTAEDAREEREAAHRARGSPHPVTQQHECGTPEPYQAAPVAAPCEVERADISAGGVPSGAANGFTGVRDKPRRFTAPCPSSFSAPAASCSLTTPQDTGQPVQASLQAEGDAGSARSPPSSSCLSSTSAGCAASQSPSSAPSHGPLLSPPSSSEAASCCVSREKAEARACARLAPARRSPEASSCSSACSSGAAEARGASPSVADWSPPPEAAAAEGENAPQRQVKGLHEKEGTRNQTKREAVLSGEMFGCQSPSASSRAASASSPSPASGETPWGSARRREPCASPKLPPLSPEPRPFKDGDDLETSDDATLAATSPRAAAREGKKDGKKSRASPASPPPAPSVAVQEKRRGAKKSASVASGKRQADSCAERAPASLGENGEEKQKQAPLSACPCCSEARGSSTAGISSASVSQDSASPSLSLALIDASLDEGLRLQAMRRQSLSPTTARLLRRGERAELNLRAFHVITTPTGLLPWTGGDEHEEDRFRGPEESSVRQEEGSKRRGGKRAKGEDAGADPDEGAQRRKAETATSGEDTRSSRLGDEESQEDVKGGRTQGCSRNDSTCEELETQDALERASGELTTPQEAETVPSAKGEGPGSGAGPHSASGTQATREGSCAEQDAARLQVATGDEQDVGKERTGNGVEQAPSSFPSSPLPSSLSSSPSPASPPASPCLCSSAAPDTMEEISFSLEALWQSFEDASVYGLEIPFLDAHDNLSYVVYIPYISALHLYPAASPPSPSLTPLLPEAQVPPLPPAAVSEQGTPVSSRGWSRTQVQGEPAAAASGAGGAKGSDSRKERKTGAEDARKNEAKKKESDPLPLSLPVEVRRTAPAGTPRPATAPSFKYMEVRLLYQRRPLYQQIERLLQGEEVMQSQLLNLLVAQSHELNQDISWLCIYWQAVQRDFSMTPAPSYLVYYRLRATREHRGERFTLRRFATVPSRLDLPFLIKNHAPLRASSFAGEDETVQKSPLASSVREIAEQRVKLAGKAASVERVSCEDEEASSGVDPARGPREGDRDEANGERREREEREEVDRAERAATEFTNKMENEVAKVTEWLRELRLNHPDFEHIKARGLGKLPPPSRGPGA